MTMAAVLYVTRQPCPWPPALSQPSTGDRIAL